MKFAVTADLHLTTRQKHPQRFMMLESILRRMLQEQVNALLIAGDLFDEENPHTADFEAICRQPEFRSIQFHILPGNHDANIDMSVLASENVTVYEKTERVQFDLMSLPILFVPYKKDRTLGEEIAPFANDLPKSRWILLGHGDWVEGMREINPLEPGVYMPLSRTDLEQFSPARAILGHIHKPQDQGQLHYPGSPSPLHINETGRRRFLFLNGETGAVTPVATIPEVLYFVENLVMLPVADEAAFLQEQAQRIKSSWNLGEDEKKRAVIRLKVSGYTTNKRHLQYNLKKQFAGFKFYQDEEPDLSELFQAEDTERAEIAENVSQAIDDLAWKETEYEPSRQQILLEALHVIYGV